MKTLTKYGVALIILGISAYKFHVEQKSSADKISILETENKSLKESVEKYKALEQKKSGSKAKTYYPDGTLQSESESYAESMSEIESEKRLQELIEARSKVVVIENKKNHMASVYLTFDELADIPRMKPDGGGGDYQYRVAGEWFAGGGLQRRQDETVYKTTTSFMW